MNRNSLYAAMLVIAFTLFLSCVEDKNKASNKLIDLKDFFRNPEKDKFQLSPDGNYFAFVAPYENRMNIFAQKINGDSAMRLTGVTDRNINEYYWVNNADIIYLKDTGGDENFRLYRVNVNGEEKELLGFPKVRVKIIDLLESIEDEIIVSMNKLNDRVFDPYRLNIVTGELTQLATNPGNVQTWITDHDGKLRVAVATEGTDRILLYRNNENDQFKPILTTSFKQSLRPQYFTPDNKKLYALSNIGHDKLSLIIFDPKTATETDLLFEHPKYDIHTLWFSDKKNQPHAVSWRSLKNIEYHYFDDEYRALHKKLEKKLTGYQVRISSLTKDEEKVIVSNFNDRTRGSYYLYNTESDKLDKLADLNPWLKEEDMNSMYCFTYPTRDGLTIEAYLTFPEGYTMETAKNLPVVVNPHGGPDERNYWRFDVDAQFLANRGYAVFQMNFRGSSGYGRKFLNASYKQWGLKMQDDITDGVNYIIEKGIADPERIAIYGASYGGYATLVGLTLTPDLYACGIDYVGVSNLFSFLNTIPPYWKSRIDQFYEMVGHPVTDSLQLLKTSPALNANKIKVPLLVVQGAKDPRVNKNESDQMVSALRDRGIEVEYMVKENEGHMFKNEENLFDLYQAIEKFLAKHL